MNRANFFEGSQRLGLTILSLTEAFRMNGLVKSFTRIAIVALIVTGASAEAFAGQSFNVKPQPSWVQTTEIPATGQAVGGESGSAYVLIDNQFRVSGASTERYYRRVEKINSSAGLDDVSELQLEFEPSYEQLTIHHIRIIRGDHVIDALKPREIKIIQQENDFYQKIYNGMLSALIFLNDVRVGDTIDYAYSLKGENPVLGGRFVDFFYLATSQPIGKLSWRLLWPAGRQLYMRGQRTRIEPRIRQTAAETEYVWESEGVAALENDGNTPGWFEAAPMIQLSEFASWGDVTRWAQPLYKVSSLSPALKRQIEEWRTKFASDDRGSRLLAALRFVQDEVRYLGIEMGPHSHLPNQPSIVFERRFGDCKDKSLLLTTILNSLGFEAHPALVNTEARHTLDEWQPSPFAFNHVIVQVNFDGKTRWFDPTATLQRGLLDTRYDPEYERALVVKEGNGALEEIPQPAYADAATSVKESYKVANYTIPVMLEVVTTYKGSDADEMRNQLAHQSISELGKAYLNYYADNDPGILADGDPQVKDDEEMNTIVITEKYRIPDFWKDGSRVFVADRISTEVAKPGISRRSQPLAVRFPVSLTHTIEVQMPDNAGGISRDSETVSDEAINFRFASSQVGHTVKLEYSYQSLRDSVPAERAAKHLEVIGKIQRGVGYELYYRNTVPAWDSLISAIAIGAVVLPLIGFGIVMGVRRQRGRSRQSEFYRAQLLPPGASPETAIFVQDELDFTRNLMTFQCRCGAPFYRPGTPVHKEGLTFDGRRLAVVRLRCEFCTNYHDVYFAYQQTGPNYPPPTGQSKSFAAPGNGQLPQE